MFSFYASFLAAVIAMIRVYDEGYWIGYDRGGTSSKPWVWTDNSNPKYENWSSDQPNSVSQLCYVYTVMKL